MKPAILQRLANARVEHHAQLTALPNVVGTAVGYKRRAGQRTKTPAVIVFVNDKVPRNEIETQNQVPVAIWRDEHKVATDVVLLGKLERQFGPPPWTCSDRIDNRGLVTTLCRNATGGVYALTCAHCMGGHDADPSTPDQIALWDSIRRGYFPVGTSGPYADMSGMGLEQNFGFSDWGVFSVEDLQLQQAALSAPALGFSTIQANMQVVAATARGPLFGTVEYAHIQIHSHFIDLSIHLGQGGTIPGDSGALWRDKTGKGVAIHAMGMNGPGGSPLSFCMFAQRIGATLNSIGLQMLAI